MRQAAVREGFLGFTGLLFGLNALRYPVGTLDHPGPGLFPLVVSMALVLLAATMLAMPRDPLAKGLEFRWRNIAILLAALGGFVLASHLVDMAAGILVLVFTAGLAARVRSIRRSAVLAGVLVVIALGFERLLGLRLGVF